MAIQEVEFDSVESLRNELDIFHPDLDGWYFRGQANEKWPLLPAVWRQGILLDKFSARIKPQKIENLKETVRAVLLQNNVEGVDESVAFQWAVNVKFENSLLQSFYFEANHAGLPVPERQLRLCNVYNQDFWMDSHLHEIGGVFNHFANRIIAGRVTHRGGNPIIFDGTLPQHYGLPTRYLDWTINPRIAAFFAGYEYLKFTDAEKAATQKIAIYAIKESAVHGPVQIHKHHPMHQNKFLHAQSGLFTQIYGDYHYLETGRWPAIEDLYERFGSEYFELRKYTLRVEHIEALMAGLKRQEISIASLMPSYNHVAEQIRYSNY